MQHILLKIFTLLSLTLTSVLCGCKKDLDHESSLGSHLQGRNIKVDIPTDNFTSTKPYNLNIIYFVPTDKKVNPDYENRISEILLNFHDFVGKWMNHWGYEGKNFGLLTAPAKNIYDKKVKIIVLYGKYDSKSYPYSNGGSRIIPEVDEFFKAYPNEKTSEHILVICPENFDVAKPGSPAPDVPFYGMKGNWAFVLDFENMSLKYNCNNKNSPGNQWIGGFFHELGHGINLPHVGETKSELAKYGIALMGRGNSTYCNSPTFITKANSAILANSQLFADKKGEFYKDDRILINQIVFKQNLVRTNVGAVIRMSAVDGIDKVLCYFVPSKYSQYFAQSAVSEYIVQNTIKPQYSFSNISDSNNRSRAITSYPTLVKAQLNNTSNGNKYEYFASVRFRTDDFVEANDTYDMNVMVVFKNGRVLANYYSNVFELHNGVIKKIKPVVPSDDRNIWIEKVEADSQESDGPVSYVTDGLMATRWHSQWKKKVAPYPHFLNFTFKKEIDIKSIFLAQGNRPPKRYQIYNIVNEGKGTEEKFIKVKEGVLGSALNQVIILDNSINTKKMQIRFLDSHDGQPYASLQEVWFSSKLD